MFKYLSLILLLLFANYSKSQVVWEHISYKEIYIFLDEMASQDIIELNSTIKPYSKSYIAQKLIDIDKSKELLNNRQLKQLQIFINDYALEIDADLPDKVDIFKNNNNISTSINPLGLYYKDSLFRFSVQPIWGRIYSVKKNDFAYHNRGGASAVAYVGKNIGIYSNVRDNYLKNYIFKKQYYLSQYEAGNYKKNEGGREGGDYSEMRGGITVNWNWGNIGLVKDHVEWADNNNGSNIFSGTAPSFAMIKLQMYPTKWFDFNYHHGWLVSMIVDSANSYYTINGSYRALYRQKFIAANMFTFKPFKNFNFSVGNSIIYSDMPVHPAYLIPFMFYKSIDHTLTRGVENQNSQMFVSISSRNIKNTHFYATYFIDEFSIKRIFNPERRNFTSFKIGSTVYNLPIKNTAFTLEYTQTNPLTYKHRVPTTTFETNNYNLGHYLIDNSRDLFVSFRIIPHAKLYIDISGSIAQKGNDYSYVKTPGQKLDEYPFMNDIVWQQEKIGVSIQYNPFSRYRIYGGYYYCNVTSKEDDKYSANYYLNRFSSSFFHGKNNIFEFGLNIGL